MTRDNFAKAKTLLTHLRRDARQLTAIVRAHGDEFPRDGAAPWAWGVTDLLACAACLHEEAAKAYDQWAEYDPLGDCEFVGDNDQRQRACAARGGDE